MVGDSKLTFEPHVRSIAKKASRNLGILRKAWRIFANPGLVVRCFWPYLLPLLEYWLPVRGSAAESHLTLLDTVVRGENFLSGGRVSCNLNHWRDAASLCMLYKIVSNRAHPVCLTLLETFVPSRVTRLSVSLHDCAFVQVRYRTDQFGR